MNVIDLGLDDEVIDGAYASKLISAWDRQFCMGLINFAVMTPKQEQKALLVLKKIERGASKIMAAQDETRDQTAQQDEHEVFCSKCGRAL